MSTWGAIRLSLGIIGAVAGTLAILAAVPAAVAAAGIQASVGRSGIVTEPLGTLRAAPTDAAVIVDDVSVRLVTPEPPEWVVGALALAGTDAATVADDIGEVVLIATPASGSVFLGVAPVDTVNDYLDGTPYSVAVRQDDKWPTVSVPGEGRPSSPEQQAWWSAAQSGSSPQLPAETLDGLTLVLMRPGADLGPEAALRLEYRVPGADRALQSAAITAAAASVGGLMLILLSGWLVVGKRRRPQPASDGTGPEQ